MRESSSTSGGQTDSASAPCSSAAVRGKRTRMSYCLASADWTMPTGRGRSRGSPSSPLDLGAQAADEPGHRLQRPHRRRQGDALELPAQRHEPLDRGDRVHPPLVADHGVHLVENDGGDVSEQADPAPRAQQQVEALRGGDQDLGGPAQHGAPLRLRGVAAAGLHPDLGEGSRGRGECLAQLAQRAQEVAADVVVERLERRHVEDAGGPCLPLAAHQAVECPQEGGQGLAASGGSRDQEMLARGDARPGLPLDVGRRAETLAKPARHERVEQLEPVGRRPCGCFGGMAGESRAGLVRGHRRAGAAAVRQPVALPPGLCMRGAAGAAGSRSKQVIAGLRKRGIPGR